MNHSFFKNMDVAWIIAQVILLQIMFYTEKNCIDVNWKYCLIYANYLFVISSNHFNKQPQ